MACLGNCGRHAHRFCAGISRRLTKVISDDELNLKYVCDECKYTLELKTAIDELGMRLQRQEDLLGTALSKVIKLQEKANLTDDHIMTTIRV